MTERVRLVERLRQDLLGPSEVDELISDRPIDRYLTGILWPQQSRYEAAEDDESSTADSGDGSDNDGDDGSLPLASLRKPSSIGVSFLLRPCAGDASPLPLAISVAVSGGVYHKEEPAAQESGEEGKSSARKPRYLWRRTPFCWSGTVALTGSTRVPWTTHGDLSVFVRSFRKGVDLAVSVALVNECAMFEGAARPSQDEMALFQSQIEVMAPDGWTIASQPLPLTAEDEDERRSSLLFRDTKVFAIGHTSSAGWFVDDSGACNTIRTDWIPEHDVVLVSAAGSHLLQNAIQASASDGLLASTLAEGGAKMRRVLESVCDGYEAWIAEQEVRIAGIPSTLQQQAQLHLEDCRRSHARMRRGLDLLSSDEGIAHAFCMMNHAIALQASWQHPQSSGFSWRPFQMAFILQCLDSLIDPHSTDRDTMDLLWFPTGGGKTEAYLGIIAFLAFLRRIRDNRIKGGGGVCSFMRYTLRLLTLQQFSRASALICASELLRRTRVSERFDLRQAAPISIGLWVGGGATPNTIADARAGDIDGNPVTHVQITICPCCSGPIDWAFHDAEPKLTARCKGPTCALAAAVPILPILTVDELIYQYPPTLLIGTVDKFAQLVRNRDSQRLFRAPNGLKPELIIQDELHLISGPLGSMVGLYEAAIDALCERDGAPIKIIGSTATIRRAPSQVLQLFNRRVFQFPPPGLDASDSCFAVSDIGSTRKYVGLSTAGRSAKFAVQAVMATLLQSGGSASPPSDSYYTLLAYYNSLRELGAALPLVQDDVIDTIGLLSRRRLESAREVSLPVELTSRVSQRDIRDTLERLSIRAGLSGAIDVVLATNMVSVGMDIQRLATMVLVGQPKSMAEYIQATSRVGRSREAPGLVVAVYNNAKIRDRSHFESFRTTHSALYRSVEASSVTPFASRARDRALHAVLVLLTRHLCDDLSVDPNIRGHEGAVRALASRIAARVSTVDPSELPSTLEDLEDIVETWCARSDLLADYWPRSGVPADRALLVGAEEAYSRGRIGRGYMSAWPTPNSLRNVEASTPVRLLERLASNEA